MLKSLSGNPGAEVRVYEAVNTVGGTWRNRYQAGTAATFPTPTSCFHWGKRVAQEWQVVRRYLNSGDSSLPGTTWSGPATI